MECPYCHAYMRSKRGLTQHINMVKACFERQQAGLGVRSDHEDPPPSAKEIRGSHLLTSVANIRDPLVGQPIPPLDSRKAAPRSPESIANTRASKQPKLPMNNTGGVARLPTAAGRALPFSTKGGYSEEEIRLMQEEIDKHPERSLDEWSKMAHESGKSSRSGQKSASLADAQNQGRNLDEWSKMAHEFGKPSRSGQKSPSLAVTLARIGGHLPPTDEENDEESDVGMQDVDNYSDEERANAEATEEEFLMQEVINPGGIPLNEHVLPGEEDFNNDAFLNINVNTEMRDRFRAYCEDAEGNNFPYLTVPEARGIRLLSILRRKKTSLDTYEEVMRWHLKEIGILEEDDRLKDAGDAYVSREKLLSTLRQRYNMTSKFAFTKPTVLPHSQQKIDIVCHDAWGCIESLLTDPRLTDDSFWFFDDDPFADPPEKVTVITDLHSGFAYREAHRLYKRKPNQIILPIVLYLDGANTGHMKNMPITALKLTLGIFTRTYRDLDQAWQVLGHVHTVSKNQAKAKKIFKESKHIDAGVDTVQEAMDEDTAEMNQKPKPDTAGKAKDLHKMLDVILESYREVQEKGFMWDLRYRGKIYEVEFVPFVIFMKCDTQEGDQLCGSFTIRTGNVKQLCRYCQCPTANTDNPQAMHDYKTVPLIKAHVDANDTAALTALSQQNINNAFYKIRFSPANSRGIHGATPSEMLHATLLGTFAMLRNILFEQIGDKSQMANDFEAMAMLYGKQCGRQSERSLPKCSFNSGIREGKLNAKEYRGILLVMVAVFRSTKGRKRLREHGFSAQRIEDWLNMLEVVLCWEAFLNQSAITKVHVAQLSMKNRYLMWMIKKVARRTSGMGLKLMKFHAITHIASDIFLFGVPLEVDTGSNESGHKATKAAARSTQKNENTFDLQTATRLDEHHVLDMAMEELQGRKLWRYFTKSESRLPDPYDVDDEIITGGTKINIFANQNGMPCYSLGLGPKSKIPQLAEKWDEDIVDFLYQCQEKIREWRVKSDDTHKNNEYTLSIYSEHTRYGQIFRGHPMYRGENHWRDWVMINWNKEAADPAQIWCFLDLRDLPKPANPVENPTIVHGNCELFAGVFVVVESGEYRVKKKNEPNSRLFLPIVKESRQTGANGRHRRRFYLADTEAIAAPCFVIPDIGSEQGKTYFRVKSRDEWVLACEDWLNEPYPDEYKSDKEGIRL